MDIFHFNNTKSKKSNIGLLTFHNFKNIHKLFRLTELCLCIVLVSWTSSRLPFALKLSGEFLRYAISVVTRPVSIFIISNAIVLTLLFKSGHLSTQSAITLVSEGDDIYKEYFTGSKNTSQDLEKHFLEDVVTKEAVYDNIEIIYEENNNVGTKDIIMEGIDTSAKQYKRSKSEKLEKKGSLAKGFKELRRSETEKCRKAEFEAAVEAVEEEEEVFVFDKLSNEEFQKKIDEFIAKQIKFHEEEKMAIVLHSQA